jgi:hypothetical protein
VAVANSAGEAGDELVPVVEAALTERTMGMPKVRASVGEPWVLDAEITSAEVGAGRSQVTVVAGLTPPEGKVVYVAQATGEAASAAEAAGEAAEQALEELGVCLNAKGTVYYCDDRAFEVLGTVGSAHGLRPEARVVFMRRGEVVAEGTAARVRDVDAVFKPDKDTPAGTIVLGDDVRIVRNGPRAAVNRELRNEKRMQRLGAWGSFLLLGGLIAVAR